MDQEITVRAGSAADAAAVAALYTAGRRAAYAGLLPPELLGEEMAAAQAELWAIRLTVDYGDPAATPVLLIAEAAGRPVGFAYVVPEPDGRALLDSLYVHPARTGSGIGRLLLAAARDRGDGPLRLEVLAGNTRAVAFYEREGGRRTAESTAHFSAGHTLPTYEYTWPLTA